MEILNQHKTIRKFQKRAVSNKILESIIYSGTRASTTGNMQLYSVVLTENKANKKKLLPLHFNQNVAKEAPVLITVIADFNRFTKWCEFNDAKPGYNNLLSFLTASIDALLLAQNICVAAENQGLGICYLGTAVYNAKEIIDIIELPKLTFPITSIAMGYPDENPELVDRIPLGGIIHKEKYEDYSKERINELYVAKENLESSIKFVEENKVQRLAQVFTDVRYKKTDNEFYSKKVLDTLKAQGFL